MHKYKLLQQLGTGSFGKVQLAIHLPTEQNVAIKTISKQKLKTNSDMQMINKQIAVFKSVNYQSLIKLYEIVQDQNYLYLVMQYAQKGDMLNYIKNNGPVSEALALQYLRQLVLAVKYLHFQKSVAHRDIKLANILLTSKNQIKLADFGLSNFYQREQELLRTSCGSPCYSAPQILKGNKYNPLAADIWSLGVVLYAMIEGALPFYDQNIKQLYKKVIKGKVCEAQRQSKQIKILIKKILQVNAQSRIKINQLLQQIDRLLSMSKYKQPKNKKMQQQSEQLTKLNSQSTEYIENLKNNNIVKILVFNQFEQKQVRGVMEYRTKNKKAKKYNQLNIFIQLLETLNVSKLSAILSKCEANYKQKQKQNYSKCGQQSKISPRLTKRELKRTNSSFTKDSLHDSNYSQNQTRTVVKARFSRNTTSTGTSAKAPYIRINKNMQQKQKQMIPVATKYDKQNTQTTCSKKQESRFQQSQKQRQQLAIRKKYSSNTDIINSIEQKQVKVCGVKDITKQYTQVVRQANNGYIRISTNNLWKNAKNSSLSLSLGYSQIVTDASSVNANTNPHTNTNKSSNIKKVTINKPLTFSMRNKTIGFESIRSSINSNAVSDVNSNYMNSLQASQYLYCAQNKESRALNNYNRSIEQGQADETQQQVIQSRITNEVPDNNTREQKIVNSSSKQQNLQRLQSYRQFSTFNSMNKQSVTSLLETQPLKIQRSWKRQSVSVQQEQLSEMAVQTQPFNIMHTYNGRVDMGKLDQKMVQIFMSVLENTSHTNKKCSQKQKNSTFNCTNNKLSTNSKYKNNNKSIEQIQQQTYRIQIEKPSKYKFIIKYMQKQVQKQTSIQILKVQSFTSLKLIKILPFNSPLFYKIKQVFAN